jgi:putative membrane protein
MSSQKLLPLAIRWLILALAIWVAAEIVHGIHLEGWKSTLVVALILGLLNLYLRPAFKLLALPITVLTLGFFIIVINAVLLEITSRIAAHIHSIHFHVDSFFAAMLGAVIISLVSLIVDHFVDADKIARNLTRRF